MGLMAWLRGFASHGGSILSRGWLATVEAPGRRTVEALNVTEHKEVRQVDRFKNSVSKINNYVLGFKKAFFNSTIQSIWRQFED